jgi:hypothetical protein
MTLHVFGSPGEKTVYLMSDIPEFEDVASVRLSKTERDDLFSLLKDYKEKCKQMSDENCARCVDEQVATHCFMRLFGLFDKGYIPRPHHGHEFGDVSLSVTIEGRPDRTMVILLKKGNPRGRYITRGHNLGREIFAQADQFIHDPDLHVLGIGVPQRIDDRFEARLKREAQQADKKLVFFGSDDFAQLIKYVADSYQMPCEAL